MSGVAEEDSSTTYGTTGVTPTVIEDGPAPRPCKFLFLWFTHCRQGNCACFCVCVAVLGASNKELVYK
jgi:hypothetical protein